MKHRVDIKAQAKSNFMGQYGISVGAFLLFGILIGAAGGTFIGAFLLVPPLVVGQSYFSLSIYRGQQGDLGQSLGVGFNDFGRSIGGMLWMWLFTWLWSLLLIIPGIIKAIAYSMTPFILADSKNVSATDALKLSMRMTYGYKGAIFVMGLSFIGWGILTAMTGGILAIFYTGPYVNTSFAGMYHELKANAIARGTIKPEELE